MSHGSEKHSLPLPLDRDLVVVDVGCRWGFADAFIDDLDKFRLFGFDPDKDECTRLNLKYSSDRIKLVPLGLSDHDGRSDLYLTKEPACSSLFEPDPYVTESYPALDCAKRVSQSEIELITLDAWAELNSIKYVDHLKIDTQGSELLVLEGAKKLLENIRTLEIEVEFNPIYKGQPLFSDVDVFLRQRGFVLWKLTNLVHYGLEGENNLDLGEDRIHYDNRSQLIRKYGGQLYWADAHYVNNEIAQFLHTTQQQINRDITMLECLNHFDLSSRLRQKLLHYRSGM